MAPGGLMGAVNAMLMTTIVDVERGFFAGW